MSIDRTDPLRSRRRFLKESAAAGVAVGCGLPLLGAGCGGAGHGDSDTSQLAMVVDLQKCQSETVREACVAACDAAHNVPRMPDPDEEIKWIWSAEYQRVFPEMVHDHTPAATREMPVLVLCNHCSAPPCTKVCPTGATWKRESDGIVMMDMHRCIGCRYCMAACPYGSRSFNWQDPRPYVPKDENGDYPSDFPTRTKGVVEKCDFCAERTRHGKLPACVQAAEAVEGGQGALAFGDLADPDSPVSRILREKRTVARRAHHGTGPNVYYIV